MKTFTYKSFDGEGLKISGCRNAQTKESVEEYLNKKMLVNYEVFESKTKYNENNYKLVSAKELSLFARQMSVMFFSHITLMEGVLLLAQQTENTQLKISLEETHGLMDKGYTLSDSMGMYPNIFGSYFLNMIEIGEKSGTLDSVFNRMSDYFDKESKIRKKLKSAFIYPAILTALMAAIVVMLVVEILPMFDDILKSMGSQIPPITTGILTMSSIISKYIWPITAVIVILIGLLAYYLKSEKGNLWFSKVKLKIPGSKYVTTRVITARFARSLSILLKSGVPLMSAFEETKRIVDNKYLEEKFSTAFLEIKNGEEISASLQKIGIFPALFIKMVFVGQNTGHLDEMLDKSAVIFDEDVDDAVEKITTMIEPILIIILSVIVGIILISVMLPMISIMNSIG